MVVPFWTPITPLTGSLLHADPHAKTKDLLKQLVVPILIFAALGGFYLWSQLK
jgi:hypothetical protein